MASRSKVLSLYRKVLRLSRTCTFQNCSKHQQRKNGDAKIALHVLRKWLSHASQYRDTDTALHTHTGETLSERPYILNEVRTLVRKNKDISSKEQISEKIDEFESRILTGIHYKIPYPRPTNVIPGATGRDPAVVTPVYLHSYGENTHKRRRNISAPVYEE